jgi:hypothetical protein
MPGDHIDVRMRYVQPLRWEAGKMRLVFPMVVGPRYIPGTQAIRPFGNGLGFRHKRRADASRITPFVRNPDSRSGHDISVSVDLDPGFDSAVVQSVSHQINVRRWPMDGSARNWPRALRFPTRISFLKSKTQKASSPKSRSFSLLPPTPVKRIFCSRLFLLRAAQTAHARGNALHD